MSMANSTLIAGRYQVLYRPIGFGQCQRKARVTNIIRVGYVKKSYTYRQVELVGARVARIAVRQDGLFIVRQRSHVTTRGNQTCKVKVSHLGLCDISQQ